MKKAILFLSLFAPALILAQSRIDFSHPPDTAALFPGGLVNTGMSERDFALSPDGSEMLYTLQLPQGNFQTIIYRKKDSKGDWSKPEVAPFAGKYSDLEPAFSQDGKKIFFSSNRPVAGEEKKDFDIWCVEKKANAWGEPWNLGDPVNTPSDEFYPSVATNGNLYFTASYHASTSKEDIYLSSFHDGQYARPVALDSSINSATYEFNAFVSPDEQFLVFTSYGRKDDKGRGDLYISRKNASGQWQPARNLQLLNSNKIDYCPFVSFDRKILFFTSERHNLPRLFPGKAANYDELSRICSSPGNGSADIYWISFDAVLKLME